jgi:hypothetical protein
MKTLEANWSSAPYICEPKWFRPTATELFSELADVMIEKGDLAEAESAARQALADRVRAPHHYLRLARIIRLRGKDPTADPELNVGLANYPAFRERLTKLLGKDRSRLANRR